MEIAEIYRPKRKRPLPPWSTGMDPETRAESAFREQDLLAAADALADAVAEHIRLGLVQLPLSIDNALARYRRERRGERQPPVEDAPASPDPCPLTTRFPNLK